MNRSVKRLLLCGFIVVISIFILASCGNEKVTSNNEDQENSKNTEENDDTLKIEMMAGLFTEVPDMDNEFFFGATRKDKYRIRNGMGTGC